MANEEKIRILDEQPAENAGSLLYIRTLAGSSDASKPTSLLANGSLFIETDTGKVFIFDEDDGWTEMQAGGGLPPVTSSDNGKVLAVEDGAWAAKPTNAPSTNVFITATIGQDGSIGTIDTMSFDEAMELYNGSNLIVSVQGDGYIPDQIVACKLSFSYTASMYYYGFLIDSSVGKREFYLGFSIIEPGVDSQISIGFTPPNKYIVTLTPTALDYSGTMDKTVAEINAAYEAGQEIWFTLAGYSVPSCGIYQGENNYPTFFGNVINYGENALVFVRTVDTDDDGTGTDYLTTVYSLTPAS